VSRLPRVISPIKTLFSRDEIEVVLISVEVWPHQVVLRLAGVPNEVTSEQLRQHEIEFEQWGRTLAESGRVIAGDPPEQPGVRLLQPLEIGVEDDLGTTYAPRSSAIGGSGREWHGDWFFAADVPASLRRLTLRVRSPQGEAASVSLEFADG
jgi:hypothetical protein